MKRTKEDTIKRNEAGAYNYAHNAVCNQCDTPYDSDVYTKGICGSCSRCAETKKRRMTDGERDLCEFMGRTMGFQLKVANEVNGENHD